MDRSLVALSVLLTCVVWTWPPWVGLWAGFTADPGGISLTKYGSRFRLDVRMTLLYLQIPEGVVPCPCISSLLPSTVCLGVHFLETSVKHPEKGCNYKIRRKKEQQNTYSNHWTIKYLSWMSYQPDYLWITFNLSFNIIKYYNRHIYYRHIIYYFN